MSRIETKTETSTDNRPLLIYDGDCGFCKRSLMLIEQFPGNIAIPITSQQYTGKLLSPSQLASAVHLEWRDGRVESGAQAIYRLLQLKGRPALFFFYQHVSLFRWISDTVYRLIASHRPMAAKMLGLIMRAFYQQDMHSVGLSIARVLLLLSYVCFFWALYPQAPGLWGKYGLNPMAPSFFSEHLQGLMAIGAGISLLGLRWNSIVPMILCWLGAFFVVTHGGPFTSFQWDFLLLEAGALGILSQFWRQSPLLWWLWRLLAFKIIFSSGVVKILSTNPAWSNFEALSVHFSTQPLPTPLSFLFHALPAPVLSGATALTLLVQLLLPFGLLFSGRFKTWSAMGLIAQQALIMLSGNYAYFNMLTIGVLCVAIPNSIWHRWCIGFSFKATAPLLQSMMREVVIVPAAFVLGLMSICHIPGMQELAPLSLRRSALSSLGINNSYGLFASMTMQRPEIIVEISSDGQQWQYLDFPFKPDHVDDCPRWVAPFQPRLDWQMWFAALAGPQRRPWWFDQMLIGLLNNRPEVLALFRLPAEMAPINYVRAQAVPMELASNKHCWRQAGEASVYLPVISRENIRPQP